MMSTGRHGNNREDDRDISRFELLQLPLRLQACEEVQCCINMILRCLTKGLCRGVEREGRLSAVIADWLLQGYIALSTTSSPEEWAEFLKVESRPHDTSDLETFQKPHSMQKIDLQQSAKPPP